MQLKDPLERCEKRNIRMHLCQQPALHRLVAGAGTRLAVENMERHTRLQQADFLLVLDWQRASQRAML